jgi:hypothetical protein
MIEPHDELDFEPEPDELGPARDEIVREAAQRFDRRNTRLSGGAETRPSAEGDIARELSEDVAELKRPEVLPLDTSRLETDAPVAIRDLLNRYSFYWMSLPIDLWAAKGRGFNELQVKLRLNPELAEELRPRTHDVLPDQRFRDLVGGEAKLGVGVGANLQFSAGLPSLPLSAAGLPVDVQAEAQAHVDGGLEFLLGPFQYRVRVPVVMHSPPGLDVVRWRLAEARMVEEQDPGLRVIFKVPREAPATLQVDVMMRARRYFSVFDAGLQKALSDLPDRFKQFFGKGAPKADQRTWDLSETLDAAAQAP